MLRAIIDTGLIWLPEKGIGYFPVDDFLYDKKYFDKYAGYATTERGKRITDARVAFVNRNYGGEVVDVGIGCGQFVATHGAAFGFDINPVAVRWLKDRALWHDIYEQKCDALTFWDSLEHIKDIKAVVGRARKFVFVSMPIFENCEHLLRSKHFRKDEHYWYFTERGIIDWFADQGFGLIDCSHTERSFGREDITTYAFWRENA